MPVKDASLNPILAGTGFCLSLFLSLLPMFGRSQSYSCWYWVLSNQKYFKYEKFKKSQSYSCWYWVLSFGKERSMKIKCVSILFLLVLGSVGSCINLARKTTRGLTPILAGYCCCQVYKIRLRTHR